MELGQLGWGSGGGGQHYKLSVVGVGVDFELIIGLGVAEKMTDLPSSADK